jgi:hypothetical protein
MKRFKDCGLIRLRREGRVELGDVGADLGIVQEVDALDGPVGRDDILAPLFSARYALNREIGLRGPKLTVCGQRVPLGSWNERSAGRNARQHRRRNRARRRDDTEGKQRDDRRRAAQSAPNERSEQRHASPFESGTPKIPRAWFEPCARRSEERHKRAV